MTGRSRASLREEIASAKGMNKMTVSDPRGVFKRTVLCLSAVLLWLLAALPAQAQEKIAAYPAFPPGYVSIKVFDREGRFAGRILPEKRYWASIDQIPLFLQNALVAIEDSRFYEHQGIDIRGMTRALVRDITKGNMAEGGSTITQQLVKNKLLTAEKTIGRKVKEGFLALDYERKYTKKQILEMYFNEVCFGNGTWGIVQAARYYFDKYPNELTDAECALLAGVPKAPARYNPQGTPLTVRDRKNLILKRMAQLKMITPAQEKALKMQPISVVQPAEAPYYLAHVRNKLVERYGEAVIEQGGLEVTAAHGPQPPAARRADPARGSQESVAPAPGRPAFHGSQEWRRVGRGRRGSTSR